MRRGSSGAPSRHDGRVRARTGSFTDTKLESIPLPVTDVDRSKAFSVDAVGFGLDHDVEPGNGMRIVQLTPPGSACSIAFGVGMTRRDAAPVHGIHLVVDDIAAVRETLRSRGVDVGGSATGEGSLTRRSATPTTRRGDCGPAGLDARSCGAGANMHGDTAR